MSVSLARLRRAVSGRVQSTGPQFQDAFLDAVADTVDDIIIESVLEVSAFDPDNPADEIGIPAKYHSVLLDGVLWRLTQEKRFNVMGEPVTEFRYRKNLARLKGQAMLDADVDAGLDYEVE